MSLLDEAKRDYRQRRDRRQPEPDGTASASESIVAKRQNEVTVDGQTFDLDRPETVQSGQNNWLSTVGKYGRPRGRDALQARKISQTAAMESITNGIVDQLVGGELAAESEEDLEGPAADLWEIVQDVLEGPHPMGNDLDDLLTAAVGDLIGPGNAYWQMLGTPEIPVAALIPLDALTLRHNVDRHGFVPDGEPPYWQAQSAFTSEGLASMGAVEPVPLDDSDLAVMHYPRGKRSYQAYPKSPSLQVLEWLEILVNSTTHHNRYYDDNQLPAGFIQILQGSNRTVDDVKDKLQAAKGDPRSVEVIGGEGQAMWVPMGDTAVNLDVIQEQQWFYQLCLGSLGLGKAEVGLIEDVNRANGEVEASRIFKRVAGPFSKQFQNAFLHVCRQFEPFETLGRPFTPTLRFTDPREERAREERLRAMWNDGGISLREYVRRRGDTDLAEDPESFLVDIDGTVVDYGNHPKFVVRELLAAARGGSPEDTDPGDEDMVTVGQGAGGHPATNGE